MERRAEERRELERRAGRRRRAADSGRPSLPVLRDDNDGDGNSPPPSVAHTNVGPDARTGRLVALGTVSETPEASSGAETNYDGVDGSSLVLSTSVFPPQLASWD